MTSATKSLLVLSLCAALFACKKKEPSSSSGSGTAGSGTGTAPAAIDAAAAPPVVIDAAGAPPAVIDAAEAAAGAKRTPELDALDQMITPILATTDQAARTAAACKALDAIKGQMVAVRKAPPAGVDPSAWTSAAESMAANLDDFAIECGEGEASDTKALSAAVESEKDLDALMAKKPE